MSRCRGLLVSFTLIATGLVALPGGRANAIPSNSPNDSLMVVTANLEEVWNSRDVQSHWDMDKFVKRLMNAKFLPDVLAVQEVRRASASYVARKLSARTNRRYRVVVSLPRNPQQKHKGRTAAYETTIIANMKRMRVLHNGGFIATAAKGEHVAPATAAGEVYSFYKFQAYALLQKRATRENFAVMSTHLHPRGYLENMDLDKYYRNRWATQMRRKLNDRYGGRKNLNYIIAGDFNQTVCLRGAGDKCYTPSPFARNLRRAGYVHTAKSKGPVDLIWAKGKPGAYHMWDKGLDRMAPGKRYSDHAYRWTILGPDRYAPTPPTPIDVDLRKNGARPKIAFKWWWGAHDNAGVGIARHVLQKKLNGREWNRIKPSGDFWHHDPEMEWGDKVSYRIRVVDRAGNATRWLVRTVEVKRKNVDKV